MVEQWNGTINMTSATSDNSSDTGTDDIGAEVTIVLNPEILNKMRKQVAFSTQADVQNLVADAINSYPHLGNLDASGVSILACESGLDGALARLHFPFNE